MLSTDESLVLLLNELKKRGKLPLHMEFSSEQDFHWITAFNELNSHAIHESVTTGFDQDEKLAILKCLTEYCERIAFSEGSHRNDPTCNTERSDGIAAFPVNNASEIAHARARENAYSEAVERYAWAMWWDHPEIMFQLDLTEKPHPILQIIHGYIPVAEMLTVMPVIESKSHELIINILVLVGGGVICGGACGRKSETEQTQIRGLSEALRHALAVKKMKSENINPVSFYERRLSFFSTPEGEKKVFDRLHIKGHEAIKLPKLQLDSEIKYSLSDLVYVHRALFENQPPFVGGALERLCI